MLSEAKGIVNRLREKEAQNAYNIGQYYESMKMPGSAVIYYRDIIQNYPDTEWTRKAQERLDEIEKE